MKRITLGHGRKSTDTKVGALLTRPIRLLSSSRPQAFIKATQTPITGMDFTGRPRYTQRIPWPLGLLVTNIKGRVPPWSTKAAISATRSAPSWTRTDSEERYLWAS